MKVKKIFFDTKFTELSRKSNLISIGLISDCENFSFYGEVRPFTDLKKSGAILTVELMDSLKMGLFAAENVIPELLCIRKTSDPQKPHFRATASSQSELSGMLLSWLSLNFEKNSVEFWGDVCAYDSLFLNELITTKNDYKLKFPEVVATYIPFDLATLFKVAKIDPDISREEFARGYESENRHNALWRCETIKICYEKLSLFLNL